MNKPVYQAITDAIKMSTCACDKNTRTNAHTGRKHHAFGGQSNGRRMHTNTNIIKEFIARIMRSKMKLANRVNHKKKLCTCCTVNPQLIKVG